VSSPETQRNLQRGLPIALGFAAFLFALAFPMDRAFSDTSILYARVQANAPPYYNVAYLPLAELFAKLFGSSFGLERALTAFSALCIGGGVALTARLATRLGLGTLAVATSGLLLAAAPAMLFFGGVIEVHGLQFFGAALAINIAWSARSQRGQEAWLRLGAAALLALVTHLSHLLLLPGLALLAWRNRRGVPMGTLTITTGCHFGKRGLPFVLIFFVAATIATFSLIGADYDSWSERPSLQWLSTMILFGRMFLDGLLERGLYPLDEAGLYLLHELIYPLGLVTAGFLCGLFALRGRADSADSTLGIFAKRALLATIPALLILPQGGVLERGGYFMTMAPLLAILIAIAVHAAWQAAKSQAARNLLFALCATLVAIQAHQALSARADFRAAAPDARNWATQVAALLQPGDKILVSDLARNLALTMATKGIYVRDLKRDLDLVPQGLRTETLKSRLAERVQDKEFPGDLWLDSALLPGLQQADLAQVQTIWPEDWRNTLLRLSKISPAIPLTLVKFEDGTSLLRIQFRPNKAIRPSQ
jgi:hypothetical protein